MPLPPYLISVAALLCEKVLQEADNVASAIRIVDVFRVPAKAAGVPEDAIPVIQAYGLVMLRGEPGHDQEHELVVKFLNTAGELTTLGAPTKIKMRSIFDPQAPVGLTVNIQVNVAVQRFGTCFLYIYLDDEEITRVPFTVQPVTGEASG